LEGFELQRDPILRGIEPRFLEIVDRMRRDVAAQPERARQRGLLASLRSSNTSS
jgi:hypothetical protein